MNDNINNNRATSSTESTEMANSDWAELTHECLTNILSRLTLSHRCKGPVLVCKSWSLACKDPSLNSVFDLETHFDTSPHDKASWWTPEFARMIDSILRSVVVWSGADGGSLTEIRTRHVTDLSIQFVAERCPKLEVLWIKSSPNVTDVAMTDIAYRCPKITELDISYCYEISHESLALIGRNCPNLKVLRRNLMNWMDPSEHRATVPEEYLNACPQDGDVEAGAIGKFMPLLEHLEIKFSKLTANGLGSICEGCPSLKYMDLSGCVNLRSRDIANATSNLKNLTELIKPNVYIPRATYLTERYGHWRLYDDRFQTDAFRI